MIAKQLIQVVGPLLAKIAALAGMFFAGKSAGKQKERSRKLKQEKKAAQDAKKIEDDTRQRGASDRSGMRRWIRR